MAVILHALARTTPRTRAELEAEDPRLSDSALARRYGVTAPTVRKWRERAATNDRSHRPHTLHCTLSDVQEAVAMEIRRRLWLPLDDLLVIVREFLHPAVSRSGLARCLKRHGLNTRPVEDKDAPIVRKTFKDYAPGFVHVDIKYLPQMADESARRYLFVAIDRATRWVYLRIYADQSEASSTDFLRRLQATAPMKIEKLLTDNGSQFTDRFTSKTKEPTGKHAFDRECALLGIEHRLIKPRHPQTNGMVERQRPHQRHPGHHTFPLTRGSADHHRALCQALKRASAAASTWTQDAVAGHAQLARKTAASFCQETEEPDGTGHVLTP